MSGELVTPAGKPVQRSTACPQCRAPQEKRVQSGGFGSPHDVCGVCGWDFEGLTCDRERETP